LPSAKVYARETNLNLSSAKVYVCPLNKNISSAKVCTFKVKTIDT